MKSSLVAKLTSVLKGTLDKLSRYDEGTVFGGLLSTLVNKKPSKNVCLCYNMKINNAIIFLEQKQSHWNWHRSW